MILPEVFKEVRRKVRSAVDMSVFDDEYENNYDQPSKNEGQARDVNPETGKTRWRTSVAVSILASIITVFYVVQGATIVLRMFIGTSTKTSSLSGSLLAAADEVETNEDRILRMTGYIDSSEVNGNSSTVTMASSGLAP